MTKKIISLYCALFLGAGLISSNLFARGASTAPGKYEDWHDIDHVQIMQPFALANYKAIVIAPVTSKGAELPDPDDNSYKPIMDALGKMTATFAAGVAEKAPKSLSVTQGTTAGAGALLIQARVTVVHPGSQAARHFGGIAGMAGGAASVGIAGEVIDGKTKKVLFTFAQERRSGANSESGFHIGPIQVGGENPYARLVNRSAKQIGGDIGSALKAF